MRGVHFAVVAQTVHGVPVVLSSYAAYIIRVEKRTFRNYQIFIGPRARGNLGAQSSTTR